MRDRPDWGLIRVPVEYFFDFSCPYAYLGSTQIESICARTGSDLEWKPMLLGGVFRAVGTAQNMGAGMPAAKARHNLNDMARWAALWEVELTVPAAHPFRCVRALRALLALPRDRWPAAIHELYRTYWVDSADIAEREVVDAALDRAGIEPGLRERALAANDDPAIKDELRARTDEAIDRGVFGAPAVFVDRDRMFWGQDRLHLVERALGGTPAGVSPTGESSATIDFYYDFSSPFAYLGSTQIESVARRAGARLRWRPMLLGAVFKQIDTPDVPLMAFSEAKRRFYQRDLIEWADYLGVPFRFATRFPMRTTKPLRIALLLGQGLASPNNNDVARWSHAAFRALWVDDRDLDDDATLRSLLEGLELDPGLVDRTAEPEVKRLLFDATGEALERGVFGAPTSIVSREGQPDQLYWGQDRLELVASAADG